MKRKLFNALAVVSALLLTATLTAFTFSRFASVDYGRAFGKQNQLGYVVYRSGFRLIWVHYDWPVEGLDEPRSVVLHLPDIERPHAIARTLNRYVIFELGVIIDHKTWATPVRVQSPSLTIRALCLPYWFTVPALLIIPALEVRRRVRRYFDPRLQIRHCKACGYDLRATPDRCPECGTIPAK